MPATGGLAVVRNNLFYIGAGKQSAWGTAVAPTWYWRFLDGTDANAEPKVTIDREGDTSPFANFAFKESQYWNIKVKEYARPQTIGYALQALLCSGSDAYVAPTFSTTLASSCSAGATTICSTADLGNVGTLAVNLAPAYAGAAYEVVTLNLVSRTTPNYTYTIAASGTTKYAHSGGDVLTTASTHVFTRQLAAYQPYSIEFAFMTEGGFTGKAIRVVDCVCYQVKLTADAGKRVVLEHDWYGSFGAIQASLQTPTYEGTNITGQPGSPFVFYQVPASTWSIDSSTTTSTNAGTIKHLEVTLKNGTGAEDLLNEYLYPTYFMPGNIDITGQLDVHFQSYSQYLETYYGSSTATTGATDSYLVGTGQASTKFQTDAINSLALSLPYVNYTAAKLSPKLDGKPLEQSLVFTASRTPSALVPFTATLTNSLASDYD